MWVHQTKVHRVSHDEKLEDTCMGTFQPIQEQLIMTGLLNPKGELVRPSVKREVENKDCDRHGDRKRKRDCERSTDPAKGEDEPSCQPRNAVQKKDTGRDEKEPSRQTSNSVPKKDEKLRHGQKESHKGRRLSTSSNASAGSLLATPDTNSLCEKVMEGANVAIHVAHDVTKDESGPKPLIGSEGEAASTSVAASQQSDISDLRRYAREIRGEVMASIKVSKGSNASLTLILDELKELNRKLAKSVKTQRKIAKEVKALRKRDNLRMRLLEGSVDTKRSILDEWFSGQPGAILESEESTDDEN